MTAVYKYLAGLVFLAVIVQIGLAGYGAFAVAKDTDGGVVDENRFEDVFGMHAGFGYLVVLLGLILLETRQPRDFKASASDTEPLPRAAGLG
jgi:hypothetical protein